jgi:hypothetical protein
MTGNANATANKINSIKVLLETRFGAANVLPAGIKTWADRE